MVSLRILNFRVFSPLDDAKTTVKAVTHVKEKSSINKSGEKVNFFLARFSFTSIKNFLNILVNKSGEKVNFFLARFSFTSIKISLIY